MLVALDTEGERVFADFTEKTTECFCPVHDIPPYTRFAHLAHFFIAFELFLSGPIIKNPRQKHSAGDRFSYIDFARSRMLLGSKCFLQVGCKAKGL